jgi:elongation factor Ts
MEISASAVKELRAKTGAGMMDCKSALLEAKGEFEKAIEILRIKGIASASKKATRDAKEGAVYAYIHNEGRLGVLVEVNCETDFVARTEQFKTLVKDIAMHIAASAPRWVNEEAVPAEILETEKKIAQEQVQGKPAAVQEMIVKGKVQKFLDESCLLNQFFVKDTSKTIAQLQKEAIASLGENITIRRFTRLVLGEGLS